MRRTVLPLIILAAIAIAVAAAWFTLMRGPGPGAATTVRTHEIEPFHRLEVQGRAEVTLVQGTAETVSVEAAGRNQRGVRVRVADGTLVIDSSDARRWWSSLVGAGRSAAPPRVTVTFKSLDAISLSGVVRLTASHVETPELLIAASGGSSVRIDDLQAKSLRIAGSGALKATLAGNVTEQNITISGAGDVRADRLVSQAATVTVSGAGSVVVNAQKRLRATISGAGNVEYYGDPQVTQRVSGVGGVKRRPTALIGGPPMAGRLSVPTISGAA